MSHQMKSNDVQLGLQMAWHKLTKIVPVITAFPFELNRLPLFVNGQQVEGWQWLAGSDDNALIGVPFNSATYSVLSNARFLAIVQNALSGTKATIESIGTFGRRSKRYATVKLGEDWEQFNVGKREFMQRLNLHDGLDKSMPLIAKAANTCIVCANTWAASLSERGDFRLSLRHTSGMADKLDNFEKAIEAYRGMTALYKRLFEEAESTPVNEDTARKVYAGFLGDGQQVATRTLNQVSRLTDLFRVGKGNRGETGLDLISAVTDYYTHESSGKRVDPWKQVESSELGSGSKSKSEFIDTVRKADYSGLNSEAVRMLAAKGELTLSLSN